MLPPLPLPGGRAVPDIAGERAANAGLVFYKFVDQWHEKDGKCGLHEKKKDWVKRFAKTLGRRDELTAHCRRVENLAKKCSKGADIEPLRLETVSRFVTGMGYEHGLENGFVFHHTLGVPYLPASGIKGLMRAFADHWQALGDGGDPNGKDWFDRIVELFGNYGPPQKEDPDTARGVTPEHRAARMGRLIVFDALPVAPVKCVADVMTPHDGGWRAKGPEVMKDGNGRNVPGDPLLSPGDWHAPNPISFLAVDEGQTFLFALGLARSGTADDLKEGYELLEAALQWIGAGAKTAVGFGRFESPEVTARRQAELAESERVRIAEEERRIAERSAHWQPAVGDKVKYYGEDRVISRLAEDGDFFVTRPDGSDEMLTDKTECKLM